MDNPPSPQPLPPQQTIVIPKQGIGCFATGCITLIVIVFAALGIICFGGWFVYVHAINTYTATEPANIELTQPSDAEYAAADGKLDQLRTAAANNQATTVSFSAADLNALLARNPSFTDHKGAMRVGIDDSTATLEMSLPLSSVPFPRLKHRWFNGSARFGLLYDNVDGFEFDPKWIEANGKRVPDNYLRYGTSNFNKSFTNSFESSAEKDGNNFWEHVKTVTLQGNQLVITTKDG